MWGGGQGYVQYVPRTSAAQKRAAHAPPQQQQQQQQRQEQERRQQANPAGEGGVGPGRRKKVTVRATPVPGRAPASGMVISLLLCARVGCAWVCVPMYLCAPVFPCVGVGSWGVLVQLGCLQAGGQAGRKASIPLPGCGAVLRWCGWVRCCALLCCAVPRGRDPGPRWHGVAWPMEVEVGIFSLAWMGMESGRGPWLMRDTDTEEGEPAPRGAPVVRKSLACEACAPEYL